MREPTRNCESNLVFWSSFVAVGAADDAPADEVEEDDVAEERGFLLALPVSLFVLSSLPTALASMLFRFTALTMLYPGAYRLRVEGGKERRGRRYAQPPWEQAQSKDFA